MARSGNNGVVVTGLGPVSSIGVGVGPFWQSLVEGRSNVQPRALQVDMAQFADLPVASMPPTEQVPGLQPHIDFLAGQECEGHRDLAYTLLAIELALADAGVTYNRQANNVGVIQVFEAPGSERTVSRLFAMCAAMGACAGQSASPPSVYDQLAPFFYRSQPFLYVHIVSKALGLHGFSSSVHNACASGAFALELAAQRIRLGLADVMIVAGGEAFDTGVRMEWFRRLGLYARDGAMRPFDGGSSGFYVGEGAAAIVLESTSHAARRGAQVYAAYLGAGFAQQGWKQVIPDVRASRLRDAIKSAMRQTGVSASELDLIVPHGASTTLSDGYEASCLAQAIGDQAGAAVATVFKPHVGHMLAACGVIEMIGLLLAMKHGGVPATLGSRPDKVKLAVPLTTTFAERPVHVALKLSTGFTGHDAASIFRRP